MYVKEVGKLKEREALQLLANMPPVPSTDVSLPRGEWLLTMILDST